MIFQHFCFETQESQLATAPRKAPSLVTWPASYPDDQPNCSHRRHYKCPPPDPCQTFIHTLIFKPLTQHTSKFSVNFSNPWNKKKKKKARFSLPISDLFAGSVSAGLFIPKLTALWRVWNSKAFMFPSFEMASESRSPLQSHFWNTFWQLTESATTEQRSLPNRSRPRCEKRRRRQGTF